MNLFPLSHAPIACSIVRRGSGTSPSSDTSASEASHSDVVFGSAVAYLPACFDPVIVELGISLAVAHGT